MQSVLTILFPNLDTDYLLDKSSLQLIKEMTTQEVYQS